MKAPLPSLTIHGRLRLANRARILEQQLLKLLAHAAYVEVGHTKCRAHLVHRLLWSSPDRGVLVVIQDAFTGHVVTVFTEAMYNLRYPNTISAALRFESRTKAMSVTKKSKVKSLDQFPCEISAILVGNRFPIRVGKWFKASNDGKATSLGEQSAFWAWLISNFIRQGVPLDALEGVLANLPNGERIQLHYTC